MPTEYRIQLEEFYDRMSALALSKGLDFVCCGMWARQAMYLPARSANDTNFISKA